MKRAAVIFGALLILAAIGGFLTKCAEFNQTPTPSAIGKQ